MNEGELNSKKLDELRTIGRTLGIKSLYKQNKFNLIKGILEKSQESPILKPRIPITQRRWFYPALFSTIAILFASVYFIVSSNLGETNKEEIITTFKDSFKSAEEYSKYIELQEALNIGLLKNFFGNEFQVFGQRNNHMFKNGNILKSKIISTDEKLNITIDAGDIVFGGIPIYYNNETYAIKKSKIELGKIFLVSGILINNKTLGMVMLNNDLENPVYAIGMVSYR